MTEKKYSEVGREPGEVMSQMPKKRGLEKEVWSILSDTVMACIPKSKNSILDWVIWMPPLPSAEVAL